VWRKLDQLITRSTGGRVLVQISFKSTKGIGSMIVKFTFMFDRLAVVVVAKKQLVLNILSVCL